MGEFPLFCPLTETKLEINFALAIVSDRLRVATLYNFQHWDVKRPKTTPVLTCNRC